MRFWLCCAAWVVGLAGCTRSHDLDALSLRKGMTATQLRAAMGGAQNIHANGSREVWQYCRREKFILPPRGFTNVLLLRGAVADWRDYQNHAGGDCDGFYRAFNWQDVAVARLRAEPADLRRYQPRERGPEPHRSFARPWHHGPMAAPMRQNMTPALPASQED